MLLLIFTGAATVPTTGVVDRRHDDQVDRGGSRSQTSKIGGL
jgi:hypothetical protein